MIPKIFENVGLQNKYSNHSLRATSITMMLNAEKVIAERSGHRSIKALRSYEKTSVSQEQVAAKSIVQDLNEEAVTKEMKKKEVDTDRLPQKANEHTFSGTLNNCTININ